MHDSVFVSIFRTVEVIQGVFLDGRQWITWQGTSSVSTARSLVYQPTR